MVVIQECETFLKKYQEDWPAVSRFHIQDDKVELDCYSPRVTQAGWCCTEKATSPSDCPVSLKMHY